MYLKGMGGGSGIPGGWVSAPAIESLPGRSGIQQPENFEMNL